MNSSSSILPVNINPPSQIFKPDIQTNINKILTKYKSPKPNLKNINRNIKYLINHKNSITNENKKFEINTLIHQCEKIKKKQINNLIKEQQKLLGV